MKILLADDHNVLRKGLRRILEEHPDLEVVGEASDGREAVNLNNLLRPDIAALEPYTPVAPIEVLAARLGLPVERIIKLDANESPYGASPRALAALAALGGGQAPPGAALQYGDPFGTIRISAPVSCSVSQTSGSQMSSQTGIPILTPRKSTGPGCGPGLKTRTSSKTP